MSATEPYYTRPIAMPKTKRDGLANFVQMIINAIEAGEVNEALLKAVDLHQDITSGIYDSAMVDARAQSAMAKELQAKRDAEIAEARDEAWLDGIKTERARIVSLLGLTAP